MINYLEDENKSTNEMQIKNWKEIDDDDDAGLDFMRKATNYNLKLQPQIQVCDQFDAQIHVK